MQETRIRVYRVVQLDDEKGRAYSVMIGELFCGHMWYRDGRIIRSDMGAIFSSEKSYAASLVAEREGGLRRAIKSQTVKAFCSYCNGTGFQDNAEPCDNCFGSGYSTIGDRHD